MNSDRQKILTDYISYLYTTRRTYDTIGKYIKYVTDFLESAEDVNRRSYLAYKRENANIGARYPLMSEAICDLLHHLNYTKIIANPPFSGNQDIAHVKLMYERLEQGGTLAAITSQHWKFASEKKCIDFRNWLKEVHGEVFEISAGEFKESGTSISTMAVVIKK